jgi:hypothetical protein
MHHYGEDAVEVSRSGTGFTIIVKHHKTGERITVTGPTKGVFDDPGREINPNELEALGRELAHGFRRWLT